MLAQLQIPPGIEKGELEFATRSKSEISEADCDLLRVALIIKFVNRWSACPLPRELSSCSFFSHLCPIPT